MISSEFEVRENNKKIMFKTRVLLFLIIFTIYYKDKNFSLKKLNFTQMKYFFFTTKQRMFLFVQFQCDERSKI